jgi:hypothetical protein
MISGKLRKGTLSSVLLTSLLLVSGMFVFSLNSEFVIPNTAEVDCNLSQGTYSTVLSDSLESTFSSYLGGSESEISDRARFGVAVDENDNAFVTGSTASPNFPSINAYQVSHAGSDDAFLAKFSSDGTLLFSTFLGGSGDDFGTNIAVDSDGNIIVIGCTDSTDFPVTPSVYQSSNGGIQDVFVAKFNNSGHLLASTFLGGSDSEWSYGMTLDSVGNVIIGGETFSDDMPLQDAYQTTYEGLGDTFVAKLDNNLQTLVFSTYLGGSQNEWWVDAAVDQNDNIILNGASLSFDFPVTDDAIQDNFEGVADVIVTKLSSDGQTLMFSTFLGGNQFDMGTGVDVDTEGNIALTGESSSYFPTMQAFQQSRGHPVGESECFVALLRNNGSMIFSTYLSGEGESMGYDTVFDDIGNIIVVGEAKSTSFPVVNPYQESHGGDGEDFDAFVAALNSAGSVIFSSYLGGSSDDSARGLAIDSSGDIVMTGWTLSTDFLTVNANQNTNNGTEDIFITKLNTGDLQTYIPDSGDIVGSTSTTTNGTVTTTGDGQNLQQIPIEILVVPLVITIVIVIIFLQRRR